MFYTECVNGCYILYAAILGFITYTAVVALLAAGGAFAALTLAAGWAFTAQVAETTA